MTALGENQHLDSSTTDLEALGMWSLPISYILYWSEHSVLWAQVPSELCSLMLVAFVCSRRRLKRHPHKSLQKRIRGRPHLISTSATVGSFEGRRHCSDHLLSVAMVFPLSSGAGQGVGVGLGGEKSHNLKKDYINHLLCNPFTVPGLVKNCCKHRGHHLTMQLLITVFFSLSLLIVRWSDKQEWVGEKNSESGLVDHCTAHRQESCHTRDAGHSRRKGAVCDTVAPNATQPARVVRLLFRTKDRNRYDFFLLFI